MLRKFVELDAACYRHLRDLYLSREITEKDRSQPVSKQDEDYDAKLEKALNRPMLREFVEIDAACYRHLRGLYLGREITEKDRSQPASKQDEDYDAELEKALSRPGLRELVEVHAAWHRYERDLYSDCKVNEEFINQKIIQ